ncbi:SPOR domain-containing protein [Ramlibacter sp. G-1-2-2]|uniref:SPOR domain-containing protein n=1 Tax=Ramlibacter agri TaxID=2728837 RepID=A0A848H2Q9_9BURK|nr:SPOR domain-containing protein [Ramlibacter agri]NML44757.1 SPOR domain-containing protein [Ramlibacter agri]
MALFKLRKKKVDEPVAAPATPAESIEAMRRRARHRLIGAVVLVLAGVVGFPLLFDTQPRPVAVDIPIEIPDRNKVKPLPPPPAAAPSAPAAAAEPATAVKGAQQASAPADQKVAQAAAAQTKEEIITEAPEKKPEPPKAEAKPQPKPEPKAQAKADDSAKARALLDGKTVADSGRFVVQVGAFAEEAKARQAQQKLERAGLKNYRQVAETEEGKRIRVRAGPFASRSEADKAAEKIKGLDLPARVLTL